MTDDPAAAGAVWQIALLLVILAVALTVSIVAGRRRAAETARETDAQAQADTPDRGAA